MSSSKRRAPPSAQVDEPPTPAPLAKRSRRLQKVNMDLLVRMAEPANVIKESAIKPIERKRWEQLSEPDKESIITAITRYCILKWTSGAGFIEESEIKKLDLPGMPEAGARVPLSEALLRLKSVFGFELLPVWKVDDEAEAEEKEEAGSAAFVTGKYMLRFAPAFYDGDHMEHLSAGASDGLTVEQRGLLLVVLSFILLEPDKAIREDQLFALLEKLDPAVFGGSGGDDERTDDSLGQWAILIKSTFPKLKYLERKTIAKTSQVDLLSKGPVPESGGSKSSTGYFYSFGPRARQMIGAPAVLDFVCSLTGKTPAKSQEAIAFGKEVIGFAHLLEEHEDE